MKLKKMLFTIFITLTTSFVSNAQLYLKNNTSVPVWVAYAKWNDSESQNHWFTVGWSTNGETTIAKTETSITSNKATCIEKESKNEDGGDPILTKTCLYKIYKTISTGYPDYKGRYSYEYSVFKKQANGSYVQIKNAALFNENKNELLSIINSKIKKDYISYSNEPEAKDCFDGASFTPFNFDQLGIEFGDDYINFSVTFGLSGACMAVDGTGVSFNLDEIQKYLNE